LSCVWEVTRKVKAFPNSKLQGQLAEPIALVRLAWVVAAETD
jgi:hypothetical protein